jgi:hypothetical protein
MINSNSLKVWFKIDSIASHTKSLVLYTGMITDTNGFAVLSCFCMIEKGVIKDSKSYTIPLISKKEGDKTEKNKKVTYN